MMTVTNEYSSKVAFQKAERITRTREGRRAKVQIAIPVLRAVRSPERQHDLLRRVPSEERGVAIIDRVVEVVQHHGAIGWRRAVRRIRCPGKPRVLHDVVPGVRIDCGPVLSARGLFSSNEKHCSQHTRSLAGDLSGRSQGSNDHGGRTHDGRLLLGSLRVHDRGDGWVEVML